jgi:acyl dehydratase
LGDTVVPSLGMERRAMWADRVDERAGAVITWSKQGISGWGTLLRATLAPGLAWQRVVVESYRSLIMPLSEPRRSAPHRLTADVPVLPSSLHKPAAKRAIHAGTGMYALMDDAELAEVVAFHEARAAYHAAWRDADAVEHEAPITWQVHARTTESIAWTQGLPAVGQSASTIRTFRGEDVVQFARLSGDKNPLHLDPDAWLGTPFTGNLVHGVLTASLFSQLMGMEVPGPGAVYLSQTLKFQAPVYIGETVTATVTVTHVREDKRIITLETQAEVTRDGLLITVLEGEAVTKLLTRRDLTA